jgi:hypothetical protein
VASQRNAPVARAYTPNALPSVAARALAFLAILLGGLCGGLIGYAITDLQCGTPEAPVVLDAGGEPVEGTAVPERDPDDAAGCRTIAAVGGLVGAAVGAGGVAVVAVLVLRAMAEWRRELELGDDLDDEPAGAGGPGGPGTAP